MPRKEREIKRKQINIKINEDQAERIERAIISLEFRDSTIYTIKDSILILCDEFSDNNTSPNVVKETA